MDGFCSEILENRNSISIYPAIDAATIPAPTLSSTDTTSKNYRLKYKQLKLSIRQFVFENAALAHEIESTDVQLISAKQERKVLLKRLMQYEKADSKEAKSSHKKSINNNGAKKTVKQESNIDKFDSHGDKPTVQSDSLKEVKIRNVESR